MTQKPTNTLEASITAAVRRHGYAAANVTRQYTNDKTADGYSAGEWFILSVDGDVWGRRRTMQELLLLAVRGPLY